MGRNKKGKREIKRNLIRKRVKKGGKLASERLEEK